ncbi:MAG: T9SS type A sorting domain-containing protein, partial [bacterium]
NASVPGINITPDGQVVLGFAAGPGGRGQALTPDSGHTFVPVMGVSPPLQADGAFVYLPDGRTRFITEEPLPTSTRERHKSHLISWISSDGLNWSQEPGVRYQPGAEDDSIASVPAAIQVADSVWRLYYVGDWYRTNGTCTAISTDWGWTWQAESRKNILRDHDVDPHPVYLSDGRVRIYHRHMREPGGIAFTDGDGLVFDTTKTQMVIYDGEGNTDLKLDPAVIKYPDSEIACYIGAMPYLGTTGSPKIIAAWATDVSTTVAPPHAASLPEQFELCQNYPNPFNPQTTIEYQLPHPGHIILRIFNLLGQEIKTLVDEGQTAGNYSVVWDGKDNFGKGVTSGVYFYQLTVKGGPVKKTRILLLLR